MFVKIMNFAKNLFLIKTWPDASEAVVFNVFKL